MRSSGEKQHDDVVFVPASALVVFAVCGGTGGGEEEEGAEREKRRVNFLEEQKIFHTSHPLFTLVYLPHLQNQNPSLSLR